MRKPKFRRCSAKVFDIDKDGICMLRAFSDAWHDMAEKQIRHNLIYIHQICWWLDEDEDLKASHISAAALVCFFALRCMPYVSVSAREWIYFTGLAVNF